MKQFLVKFRLFSGELTSTERTIAFQILEKQYQHDYLLPGMNRNILSSILKMHATYFCIDSHG